MKNFALLLVLMFMGGKVVAQTGKTPEYLDSFDPAKGFKPAQTNLTDIYLQIAGSLEYYGSPIPYFRHVVAEQRRISEKYQNKFGNAPKSPELNAEYVDRLAAIWDKLSPKLGLDPLAKGSGNMMRDAIKGTRGTGTIIITIFNEYQSRVFDFMAGKGGTVSFDDLKSKLISDLELNNPNVNEEGYEITRRDAISWARFIRSDTRTLFKKLDTTLPPADAAKLKSAITTIILNVGQMADAELRAGISEWALDKQTVSKN